MRMIVTSSSRSRSTRATSPGSPGRVISLPRTWTSAVCLSARRSCAGLSVCHLGSMYGGGPPAHRVRSHGDIRLQPAAWFVNPGRTLEGAGRAALASQRRSRPCGRRGPGSHRRLPFEHQQLGLTRNTEEGALLEFASSLRLKKVPRRDRVGAARRVRAASAARGGQRAVLTHQAGFVVLPPRLRITAYHPLRASEDLARTSTQPQPARTGGERGALPRPASTRISELLLDLHERDERLLCAAANALIAETAGIEQVLSERVSKHPDDVLALTLLAFRHVRIGWEIQGSAMADQVSEEQFDAFFEHPPLRRAHPDRRVRDRARVESPVVRPPAHRTWREAGLSETAAAMTGSLSTNPTTTKRRSQAPLVRLCRVGRRGTRAFEFARGCAATALPPAARPRPSWRTRISKFWLNLEKRDQATYFQQDHVRREDPGRLAQARRCEFRRGFPLGLRALRVRLPAGQGRRPRGRRVRTSMPPR